MTPEQITAIVQALGYPVCVSIALFFALVFVFRQYVAAVDRVTNAAIAAAKLAEQSNAALRANTDSNLRLTHMLEAGTLCQAPHFLGAPKRVS